MRSKEGKFLQVSRNILFLPILYYVLDDVSSSQELGLFSCLSKLYRTVPGAPIKMCINVNQMFDCVFYVVKQVSTILLYLRFFPFLCGPPEEQNSKYKWINKKLKSVKDEKISDKNSYMKIV